MKLFSLFLLLALTGCASQPAESINMSFTCNQDVYTLQEIAAMLDYIQEKEQGALLCNMMVKLHLRAS